MKVILLNDTSNDCNWGCKTTSYYLKKLIGNGACEVVGVPISFSNSFKERVSGHIKLLALTLNIMPFAFILKRLLKFYFVHISWNKKWYKEIAESSHVIMNGEGTIHVYNRAVAKWMFYLIISKSVFEKPISIVNHTFNLDTPKVKSLCEVAYGMADNIFTREKVSKDILIEKMSIKPSKVWVVGDAAFMVEQPRLSDFNIPSLHQKQYFTICGNVRKNQQETTNLLDLVAKISKDTGLLPVFLEADKADRELLDKLKSTLENLIEIDNFTPVDKVVAIINGADFFITGRFHPFIFGLVTNTKMYTFKSNTHKIEGVKDMIKYPLENLDLSDVEDDFAYIYKNSIEFNNQFDLDIELVKRNIIKSYSELYRVRTS